MSLTLIDNQPIKLEVPSSSEPCYEVFDHVLPVESTDVTQFQFRISECFNQIITESDFSLAGVNWSTAVTGTGQITHYSSLGSFYVIDQSGGGAGTANLYTSEKVLQTGYYKLKIGIGSWNLDDFSFLNLYGNTSGTLIKSYYGNSVEAGELVIYFEYDSAGAHDELSIQLGLNSSGGTDSISIFYVELYRMPVDNLKIGLCDVDTGVPSTVLQYSSGSAYFNIIDDYVTVSLDWAALKLSTGCYRVCLYDPCQNTNSQLQIDNQWFDGDDQNEYWTATAGTGTINVTDGIAAFSAGSGMTKQLENSAVLESGVSYTVEVDLLTVTGATTLEVGSGLNTATQAITVADSNTTITLTLTGGGDVFYITGNLGTFTFDVEEVRVYLASDSGLLANYESNILKLGVFGCSVLVRMCADNDFQGFKFIGTGFTISVRVDKSELRLDGADFLDMEGHDDSLGFYRNTHGRRRTRWEFASERLPQHLAECFLNMPIMHHVYLDGVEYAVPVGEEPGLSRVNRAMVGYYNFSVILRKKEEQIVNITDSAEGSGCASTDNNYIILPDLSGYLGIPGGGRIIAL